MSTGGSVVDKNTLTYTHFSTNAEIWDSIRELVAGSEACMRKSAFRNDVLFRLQSGCCWRALAVFSNASLRWHQTSHDEWRNFLNVARAPVPLQVIWHVAYHTAGLDLHMTENRAEIAWDKKCGWTIAFVDDPDEAMLQQRRLSYVKILSLTRAKKYKKAELSQRRPRDAPNIWVRWKISRVLTSKRLLFFPPKFVMGFCSDR